MDTKTPNNELDSLKVKMYKELFVESGLYPNPIELGTLRKLILYRKKRTAMNIKRFPANISPRELKSWKKSWDLQRRIWIRHWSIEENSPLDQ